MKPLKFKAGDRVVGGKGSNLITGEKGTIISEGYSIAIRWDRYDMAYHNCDGRCEQGHGWYAREGDIELLPDPDKPRHGINRYNIATGKQPIKKQDTENVKPEIIHEDTYIVKSNRTNRTITDRYGMAKT